MSNIEKLLNKFSERELAFFFKYRYDQYTPLVQEEIEEYMLKVRKLDTKKIEILFNGKIV